MQEIVNWLFTGIALVGTVLNIKKQKIGFLFWCVSNAYWCYHNVLIGEFAQCFLYLVFLTLSSWGYVSWAEE